MRRWVVRFLGVVLIVAAVACSASAAGASSTGLRGVRGTDAQAGMYAVVLQDEGDPIQILSRRCASPRDESGCERISARLRGAIESKVDPPVAWVSRMWRHAGTFFVLSPFSWEPRHARFRHAWTDPRPFGCNGGGKSSFTRLEGEWELTGGGGYAGCP